MTHKERKYRLKTIAERHLDKRNQKLLDKVLCKCSSYKKIYFAYKSYDEDRIFHFVDLIMATNQLSNVSKKIAVSALRCAESFKNLAIIAKVSEGDLYAYVPRKHF